MDDLVVGGDLGERQRLGGIPEAVQVLDQPKDAALVEAQSLPDTVTTLNDTVERTDACLIAMNELTADVDDEISVPLVKRLKDDSPSSLKAIKS
jgi:hypothetical protein